MKMVYWNIRGIGNPESRITHKNLFDTHKLNIIFIAEPMIPFENVPHLFKRNMNIIKFCLNNCLPRIPNLWGLWGNDLDATVIFVSDQCIALEITFQGKKVFVAATPFKFFKSWTTHADCKRLVKETWSKYVFGGGIVELYG